jgi:hypothetical protein
VPAAGVRVIRFDGGNCYAGRSRGLGKGTPSPTLTAKGWVTLPLATSNDLQTERSDSSAEERIRHFRKLTACEKTVARTGF